MPSRRDYYEILGIERTAGEEEIKKAYRKLAFESHPDRNQGDKKAEERFKEATEAYEVLRDAERRAQYDRFGHAAVGAAPGGFGGGGGGGAQTFHDFDLSDALRAFMRDFGGFGDMFGAGTDDERGRGHAARGADIHVRLPLTLAEVAQGAEKRLKVKVNESCSRCHGEGAEPGTRRTTCATCHGAGQVRRVARSVLGQFVNVSVCPTCGGDGSRTENPCKQCAGEGRVPSQTVVSVKVPAGVSSGNYIPLRGKGHAGRRGGPAGDILVIIEEEKDPRFERSGDDLHTDLLVSYPIAVLGGEVEVPTLLGRVKMEVPAGTPAGKAFRVRGKGLPRLRGGGAGDLIVRVGIFVPARVKREERKVLEDLGRLDGFRPDGSRG